jgi:cytochrome c-type biogenesis protein CcmH
MKRKILLAIFTIAAAFFLVYVVYAQEGGPDYPTDDQVNAVAKKLYCPVCPNTPLDVCETKACQDWRAQIRDQMAQGWNEEQIIAYFVNQYGERVLGEPQRKGFTSMVWVLPLISVILGLIVVWQVLHSWRSKQGERAASTTPDSTDTIRDPSTSLTPEILALVEKELKETD